MDELKKEVEALLFASAKMLSVDELSAILKKSPDEIRNAADALRKEYDERDSPMIVVSEGSGYKVALKDKYISTVQKIVIETELPRTVLETLAVIAYKHPALQSEITRIRTNKAYDHLRELEELGYIEREKHGRTKKIKLTHKFFQYFDIPQDKLNEAFAGFREIEKVIEEKQEEARQLRQEIKAAQENQKILDEDKKAKTAEGIQHLDSRNKELLGTLEVIEELPEEPEEDEKEKLGSLKVVKLAKKKEISEPKKVQKTEEGSSSQKEAVEKQKNIAEQMEKESDKLANQIIGGLAVAAQPCKDEDKLDEAIVETEKEKQELEKKDAQNEMP